MKNWNSACFASIRKEKAEVAKRYNIILGQTEIYCAKCEKRWPGCIHSLPIKQEYNHPIRTLDDYRKELEIKIGMSKEEALEKFRQWRENMKTCRRCEGDKYISFCPIHLICKEADNVRDAEGNDNRGRAFKIDGFKALRIELSEARKRTSIR